MNTFALPCIEKTHRLPVGGLLKKLLDKCQTWVYNVENGAGGREVVFQIENPEGKMNGRYEVVAIMGDQKGCQVFGVDAPGERTLTLDVEYGESDEPVLCTALVVRGNQLTIEE